MSVIFRINSPLLLLLLSGYFCRITDPSGIPPAFSQNQYHLYQPSVLQTPLLFPELFFSFSVALPPEKEGWNNLPRALPIFVLLLQILR